MDRNTITAFLLIGLILMVFQFFNRPTEEELKQQEQQRQEQVAEQQQQSTTNTPAPPPANTAPPEQVMQLFNQSGQQEGTKTTLENDQFAITFDSKGGVIERVELKDYKAANGGGPVVLLEDDPENQFTYEFFVNNMRFSTQDLNFQVTNQDDQSITYRLSAGETGGYIEQKYTLNPNDKFMVDYDLNIVGMQNSISDSDLALKWRNNIIQQEENQNNERIKTAIYFMDKDDGLDYLAERTDDDKALEKAPIKWLSMKQQFFNATLVPEKELKAGNLSSKTPTDENDATVNILTANLYIPYDKSQSFSYPMHLYLGPNHYETLKAKGKGMEQIVYMGWTVFRWVNMWVIMPIFNFLSKYIGNYGIVILLLTVFIKMLLFPLTYRSYKSMAKMNILKPDIEALKEKYPDNAQRQQQETMQLYSKAGVNPLGGCLPQMLQMPILIAMYYFFPSIIDLRQESFLWAHDLSTFDSILNLPFTIPFYGAHVSLFTLLSAGASLAYTQMNAQMQATSNPQMKIMQYIMPFFLIFIFNSFPAALTFYFFLSNLITYAQQFVIKKFIINEDELRKEIKNTARKPKKQSKFQKRLEKMLKDQQMKQAKKNGTATPPQNIDPSNFGNRQMRRNYEKNKDKLDPNDPTKKRTRRK